MSETNQHVVIAENNHAVNRPSNFFLGKKNMETLNGESTSMKNNILNGHGDMTVNFVKGDPDANMCEALLQQVKTTADMLLSKTKYRPQIAIICGTGIGGLANLMTDTDIFDYTKIPNFPISTVPGHAGRLVFGLLNGIAVVCMQGRTHTYEGFPMWQVTLPVRVFHMIGVKILVATNASGGLNPDYNVGDFMILKDHINFPGLCGLNALTGLNSEKFGPRFVPMSMPYDPKLRKMARSIADKLGFSFVHEGVYFVQSGPCYETTAECRMIRLLGADVTGMSTAPEVSVARQCDMRCFAMSLVTNNCSMEYENHGGEAFHEEVLETGRRRAEDMQQFMGHLVVDFSELLGQEIAPR